MQQARLGTDVQVLLLLWRLLLPFTWQLLRRYDEAAAGKGREGGEEEGDDDDDDDDDDGDDEVGEKARARSRFICSGESVD